MSICTFPSYGKINLGLLLLQKRSDGYHDIATVFQQIDLHDTLSIHPSSTFRLTVSEPSLSVKENNLIYRAFKMIQNKLQNRDGVDIHLEKRIPVGGGLGGGSSNAAVTLMALNRIWGDKLSRKELMQLGGQIGSDVPFFLMGGTALGQGRGEILQPLSLSMDWWIVLVCPDISISTAWAYKHARIALTKEEKFTNFRSIFEEFTPSVLRNTLRNELEDAVFQKYPLLGEIKEILYQKDAFYASMSGSGSSVYGLFNQRIKAETAVMFFSIEKGVSALLCKPISSHLE
jgi:4-diphosphocytidyl-2-C-methyl-D-erythritol kinase